MYRQIDSKCLDVLGCDNVIDWLLVWHHLSWYFYGKLNDLVIVIFHDHIQRKIVYNIIFNRENLYKICWTLLKKVCFKNNKFDPMIFIFSLFKMSEKVKNLDQQCLLGDLRCELKSCDPSSNFCLFHFEDSGTQKRLFGDILNKLKVRRG